MERVYAAGTRPITVGRPISSGGGNDWDPNKLWSPTTAPSPPSTVAARAPQVGKTQSNLTLSEELDNQIIAANAKLTGKSIVLGPDVSTGAKKAPRPLWQRAGLGLLDYSILKPLQTLDIGRRVVLSTIKEFDDISRQGIKGISPGDWWKQTTDVNLQSKDLFNINTGNKWVDSALGFAVDVLADPTTYLTLGTGTAAKIAMQQAAKNMTEQVSKRILLEAAEELATKGVKEVTANLSTKIAKELGEKATAKELRIASASFAVEAAQLAKASNVAGADKMVAQAAAKWAAVGPRKTIGAGAREANAVAIQGLRRDAVAEAASAAGTAQGRRAQQFVDVVTEDFIAKFASRGTSAITKDIAQELGIAGGLRWGAFGAKVALPKTAGAVRLAGKGFAATRLGTMKLPTGQGVKLAERIVGRNVPEMVFDAKTGLRTGAFKSTADALQALTVISKNIEYKGFAGAVKAPIKLAMRNIQTKENNKYRDTVYQLLKPGVDLDGDVAAQIGRAVSDKEILFAKALNKFKNDITGAATKVGMRVVDDGGNWFPEALSNDAVKWLSQKANKATLKALGFDRPPLPGQNMGGQLAEGVVFFGKPITADILKGGIGALNDIARANGFRGNFFDTNAFRAVEKYGNKFGNDYALASMANRNTMGAAFANFAPEGGFPSSQFGADGIRTLETAAANATSADATLLGGGALDFPIPVPSSNTVRNILTRALPDEVRAKLAPWMAKDIDDGLAALRIKAGEIEKSALSNTARDGAREALDELDIIFNRIKELISFGDDVADAWVKVGHTLTNNYATLFATSPTKVVKFIENLNPSQLKTMVRLGEDAFVALDSSVVPDALVRADLAGIFSNIRKLKNIDEANAFIRGLNTFNQGFKTWMTTSIGFHTRNTLNNYFVMFAGGGKIRYMTEGGDIATKWKKYLEDTPAIAGIKGSESLRPLSSIVDDFITAENIPKHLKYATREALISNGGAGFGDLEEIFGGVATRSMGVTGREATGRIPFTRGKLQSDKLKAASELAGKIPTASRKVGGKIEDYARFIFTFDGLRQGLSIQDSVARTSKFLVDYSDVSQLDYYAKQFIPFWQWMSRNLPTQFVNMYTNPGMYQKYNNARRNFENSEGESLLSPNYIIKNITPDYIKRVGGTVIGQIPGLGAIYIKPDFGFPGAGSPSPLQTGVTNPDSLLASVSPLFRAPMEAIVRGKTFFGERKLEGLGEKTKYVGEQYLPQLSFLAKHLNILSAGTDTPLKYIPGIYSSTTKSGNIKSTPDNIRKIQFFLSAIGLPIGIMAGNEENAGRYNIIDELKKMLAAEKAKGPQK